MPSILDPQGQANTSSGASVARAVAAVDASLLERGGDEQLQARNQEIIAAFLITFAGAGRTPEKHNLVTVTAPHSLGPQHYRICSCGCIAGPYRAASTANVEGCQVQQAERLRADRLKSLQAERVVQALLHLSQGV